MVAEEEEDRKEHPWLIVVFQLFYRHHVCVCAVFFLVRQQVEFRFNCVWYMLKFVQASYLLVSSRELAKQLVLVPYMYK